jgi:F-type H+-transporting ATPase subunit delta
MKISNIQYAKSLLAATSGKASKDLKTELDNFVRILAQHNDLHRSQAIIAEYERLWSLAEGLVEAELISASKLDPETVKEVQEYIARQTGAKKVEVKQMIDKSILGGFVLRFRDQIIDGSASTMIRQFKNKLSQ